MNPNNHGSIIGRAAAPAEIIEHSNGTTATARVIIYAKRDYKNKTTGNYDSDRITLERFLTDKNNLGVYEHIHSGSRIAALYSVSNNDYEDAQGVKHYQMRMNIESISLLDNKSETAALAAKDTLREQNAPTHSARPESADVPSSVMGNPPTSAYENSPAPLPAAPSTTPSPTAPSTPPSPAAPSPTPGKYDEDKFRAILAATKPGPHQKFVHIDGTASATPKQQPAPDPAPQTQPQAPAPELAQNPTPPATLSDNVFTNNDIFMPTSFF